MYTYEIAKLMHKYSNNHLGNNFNDYFSKVSSVNPKDTRLSNQKLVQNLPRFRLSKYQRSIKYKGAKYEMLFLIIRGGVLEDTF